MLLGVLVLVILPLLLVVVVAAERLLLVVVIVEHLVVKGPLLNPMLLHVSRIGDGRLDGIRVVADVPPLGSGTLGLVGFHGGVRRSVAHAKVASGAADAEVELEAFGMRDNGGGAVPRLGLPPRSLEEVVVVAAEAQHRPPPALSPPHKLRVRHGGVERRRMVAEVALLWRRAMRNVWIDCKSLWTVLHAKVAGGAGGAQVQREPVGLRHHVPHQVRPLL